MISSNIKYINTSILFEDYTSYISALNQKAIKKILDIESAVTLFLEHYCSHLSTAGKIQWPVLKPFNGEIPSRLVPFHEVYSRGGTDAAIHFYINDSLFTRVFRNLDKYIPFFQNCKNVIGTDLSQYADMPASMRMRNAYCNMLLQQIIQSEGVSLIPNQTWSLRDSFQYSFSTNLKDSVIAINSNGIHSSNLCKYLWLNGYNEALAKLSPSHIIRYGEFVEGERREISSYYCNERLKILRDGIKW